MTPRDPLTSVAVMPRPRRATKTLSAPIVACLVAGSGLACEQNVSGDDGAAALPTPPPAKDVAELIEGDAVTIPAAYKGLRPGMTLAEAKALFAGMPDEDTVKDTAFPDVYFAVGFDQDAQSVSRLYFSLPGEKAKELIEAKWGPGLATEDMGREQWLWFNPKAGLRATLKPGFGEDWDLEITRYVAYKSWLGEGPELAFEAPGALLGATADQLRETYADEVVEKSKEEARADRKKLEAMVGGEVKQLGAPKPSLFLSYPPTEFDALWTRVHFTFGKGGAKGGAKGSDDAAQDTVQRFWFSLPWEPHPPAKEEMFALFKAKWGEPTQGESLGEKVWVFGGPRRIEVKDNDITKTWDISVQAAPAG